MSAVELRELGKGANAPMDGRRCAVTASAGAVSLDVLTFQLGGDGRVKSDSDVIFYNQPSSPEGAVTLTGSDVTILLDAVPQWVAAVTIAVAVAGDEPTAPLPPDLQLTLTTESNGFRCPSAGLTTERAAVLVELYRRNGLWKLRNVSAGWEQGLAALLRHHGVSVDEPTEQVTATSPASPSADDRQPPPLAAPVQTRPSPLPTAPAPAAAPPVPAPPELKGKAKKRIIWLAATVAALLVLAAILGRSPDTNQAAPVTLAAAAVSTASTPAGSSGMAATTSSVFSTTATTVAAAILAAPVAVAAIHDRQSAQAAVRALESLRVAGRAPKTGYSRAQFGQAWTDDAAVDGGHNGCDTRNDILRRDLRQFTIRTGSHGCAVTSGTFTDPYTGKALAFSSSSAAAVQIDHVVALSNAWQTGAAVLTPQRRQDLANDPLNLQATASAVNQAKGDGDAATWLPPNKSYRCTYVARQVAVKARYGLWVTPAERQAIAAVLTGCGATALPQPTPKPTPARSPQTTPARSTTALAPPTTAVQQLPAQTTDEPVTTTESSTEPVVTTPVATTHDDSGAYYPNCKAARAAHAAPLHRGDPGYRAGLDRDDDGVACES